MRLSQLFPLLLVLTALFYFPSFFYFFSQDDFIHLSASVVNNLANFLNFFNPWAIFPDMFFYRPLTTQFFFFLNNSLFGLNPFPFRFEAIILHAIGGVIFYLIILEIWNDKKVALISSILYTISAVHFLSIYYISAFQEIGRAFFIFLSIYFFLKDKLFISLLTFALALLSKETSLVLPIILLGIEITRSKSDIKITLIATLKRLIPYFLIVVFYIGVRFLQIQTIFNTGGYQTNLSFTTFFQNLKWYTLWIFGLPEILVTYPSLKPNSILQFLLDFNLAKIILICFFIFIFSSAVLFYLYRKNFSIKVSLGLLIIFLGSLLPVLFLKAHLYPHYLNLSLLAFLPPLTIVYKSFFRTRKILVIFSIFSFFILQIASLELTRQTHWTTHRAEVSKYYYENLNKQLLPQNSNIVFQGNSTQIKELSVTLAKHYGLNVWFPGQISSVKYLNPTALIDTPGAIIIPITKY
jgi:hypothetical protein